MNEDQDTLIDIEPASEALVETGELVSVLLGKLEAWLTGFVEMLPNLIVAVLVVTIAALAARFLSRVFGRATKRATHNQQVANLVRASSRLGIFFAGLFVALGLLNLDKTVASLLAGVGVVGLALGFAFQDIASNFMSGIILAVRKPFEIGDLVTTHDTSGHVERVSLRATVLKNFDGQLVVIPNKEVLQNPIVNFTRSGERRVEVPVGVAYGSDLAEARKIAIAALEKLEARDESKPVDAIYTGFGGSSIDLSLRFWIDVADTQSDYLTARSQAIMAVKSAFDEAEIEIPFPIRTLDFGDAGPQALAALAGNAREADDSRVAS